MGTKDVRKVTLWIETQRGTDNDRDRIYADVLERINQIEFHYGSVGRVRVEAKDLPMNGRKE